MKKNIGIVFGLMALVLVVGYVGMHIRSNPQKQVTEEEVYATPTGSMPTVSDTVVVVLQSQQGGKAVNLDITGIPFGVTSIDYELIYTTSAGLPRGVLGKISVKDGKNIKGDDIILGTCSSGKCVYDAGVKEVELNLKFNSDTGTSIFRKTFPLSSSN